MILKLTFQMLILLTMMVSGRKEEEKAQTSNLIITIVALLFLIGKGYCIKNDKLLESIYGGQSHYKLCNELKKSTMASVSLSLAITVWPQMNSKEMHLCFKLKIDSFLLLK